MSSPNSSISFSKHELFGNSPFLATPLKGRFVAFENFLIGYFRLVGYIGLGDFPQG